MNKLSTLAWAFLFAGCTGVLGEILYTAFGAVTTEGPAEIAIVLALLAMGVIGMALVLCGAYQKLEDKAEMGIMGTFIGFVPAAASMFAGMVAEGEKPLVAFAKTMLTLCALILVGCVVALIIAAAIFFIG